MAKVVQSFRHEAMNTWFEISLSGIDPHYARKAAAEAFREIDRLENILSRFREGSDVDILNKRGSLEPVRVTEECWNCLLLAMDLEILTRGVFSVAFETIMDGFTFGQSGDIGSWLEMDPARNTVFFKYPNTTLDLGGIGKGYALDLVVQLLEDWDIGSLMIHSGTSSVVARGNLDELPGWPVSVGADYFPQEIRLLNSSLSGSGLAVQDSHILDLGRRDVLQTERRTWAWASSGGLSDALSTSFMLMPMERIQAICETHSQLGALIVDPSLDESHQVFGVAMNYL